MVNPEIVNRHSNGEITFEKTKARFNIIQRNRNKLEEWYKKQGKKSPFPKRDQKEVIVTPKPSGKLLQLLNDVERYGDYILTSARDSGSNRFRNVAGWVAIHLQKRAISSPAAIIESLKNRISVIGKEVKDQPEQDESNLENYVHDLFNEDERTSEEMMSYQLDYEALSENEINELKHIVEFARTITPKEDEKLQKLKSEIIPELFSKDTKIIIFTKYSDTLDYLEKNLKSREYDVFVMHGDMSFSSRSDIFGKFDRSKKALLIATDVISEGLNLQRLASGIVHYELLWNPNRLEQRNGRIDRIGQKRETVNIRTLVIDKSLDKEILDLLLFKRDQIKLDRDYTAAYFGDEEYLKSIISQASVRRRNRKRETDPDGPDLFSSSGVDETKKAVRQSFAPSEEDLRRKKKIEEETFYSSLDIELPEIDRRISETKIIVGSQEEVQAFVKSSLPRFDSAMMDTGNGFYEIRLRNLKLLIPKFGEIIGYILDTFPILQRKDIDKYGSYRTKETILKMYDEFAWVREEVKKGAKA